jgi:hypothetical protein
MSFSKGAGHSQASLAIPAWRGTQRTLVTMMLMDQVRAVGANFAGGQDKDARKRDEAPACIPKQCRVPIRLLLPLTA